jgi:hypothetical protein
VFARESRATWLVPACAAILAIAYLLAATLSPEILPLLTVAAVVAACAIVLTHRRSRRIVITMVAIGTWLALGFVGAWILRDGLGSGLLWIVGTLFVLPLPVIPVVYWLTSSSVPGPRSPVPGAGGRAE